MNFEQLRYIAYLTETSSLTKVAEHFFTSHQVVRNAITNLENELQVPLLHSTNRGTVLTPAGLCVAKAAQQFQQQYATLIENLKEFQISTKENFDLHLYLTPSIATEYYLNLYDSFFKNKENINLIMHSFTFPQMLEESNITENNIYLTQIFRTIEMQSLLDTLLDKYQLIAILFPPATNYLCMHKTSKYAKINTLSLADIKDVPIYEFLNTNPLCLSNEQSSLTLQYFTDYSILKRNIKKNHAVGVIKKYEFDYYFGENNSEYILRPLKTADIHYVVIIQKDFLEHNPVIQEFILYLQEQFEE